VSVYGGWDDSDPIPTDYMAWTYAEGIYMMYNHTKICYVEVDFYDPEGWYSYGEDTEEVPYSSPDDYPTCGSAVVYGADYCNEEYGYSGAISVHYIECRAPDGMQMVQWLLTPIIEINPDRYQK